jgi:hypothetical protein
MAALIDISIPPSKGEVVRDQIAVLLTEELAKQYQLNSSYPKVTKAWVERFIPFDAATELPTINVSLAKAEYENKSARSANCEYLFFIDIYTIAATTNSQRGDELAMKQMKKIAGMIWAILSHPDYCTLGLPAGYIGNTMVKTYFIGDKSKVKDALSDVVGRMHFTVSLLESTVLTATGNPLEISTTKVKMGSSDEGFYYEYNPVI